VPHGDHLVDAVLVEARRSTQLGALTTKCWNFDSQTVVLDFRLAGQPVAMDVKIAGDLVSLCVIGRNNEVARHLRSVLIGKAVLVNDPKEIHVLHQWDRASASPRSIVRLAIEWITWLTMEAATSPNEFAPELHLPDDHASVFWWDERSNFGDTIGPWIVQHLTNKTVVNGRRIAKDAPTLATVGSIIGYLDRGSVDIWGAGLMKPLTGPRLEVLRSLRDVQVHAVRGALTRRDLVKKLGWDVPEVYGDPGLLLPRFHRPTECPLSKGKVALLPHTRHAGYFDDVDRSLVHLVDASHGLEQVVNEIASASACVSSSLHGIIVAQAYGIPWTRLKISDRPVNGDYFKFEDFFTVLDRSAVSSVEVEFADIGSQQIACAAAQASLPSHTQSLEPLLAAFPLARRTSAKDYWQPPRIASRPLGELTRRAARRLRRSLPGRPAR
jgi:hypothetical protein